MNLSQSIDQGLTSHDKNFRMKLRYSVINAYIEEIEELKKPQMFGMFFKILGAEADKANLLK